MRWEVSRWFLAGGVALVVLVVSTISLANMLGGVGETIQESGRDDAVSARLDDLAEDPMMTGIPPGAEVLNEARREECDGTGPWAPASPGPWVRSRWTRWSCSSVSSRPRMAGAPSPRTPPRRTRRRHRLRAAIPRPVDGSGGDLRHAGRAGGDCRLHLRATAVPGVQRVDQLTFERSSAGARAWPPDPRPPLPARPGGCRPWRRPTGRRAAPGCNARPTSRTVRPRRTASQKPNPVPMQNQTSRLII